MRGIVDLQTVYHLGWVVQPLGWECFYLYERSNTSRPTGEYFRGTLVEAFSYIDALVKRIEE